MPSGCIGAGGTSLHGMQQYLSGSSTEGAETKNDADGWNWSIAEKRPLVSAVLTTSSWCPGLGRKYSREKWVNWQETTLTMSLLIDWYNPDPISSHSPTLSAAFTINTKIKGKDFPSLSF